MSKEVERLKQKIVPILQKEGVLRSSLFGSFARGEQREDSDIDLLVELMTGKSLLDLIDLEDKLSDAIGHKVDAITYASVHPLLRKEIKKDQIPLL